MKKTIEEVAEEYADNYFIMQDTHYSGLMQGFKAGAKYQSEQMYSEEEVVTLLKQFVEHRTFIKPAVAIEWFTQFKKK